MLKVIERALKAKQTAGQDVRTAVLVEGRKDWKVWQGEGQERQGKWRAGTGILR